jgi:hypothetical protein
LVFWQVPHALKDLDARVARRRRLDHTEAHPLPKEQKENNIQETTTVIFVRAGGGARGSLM